MKRYLVVLALMLLCTRVSAQKGRDNLETALKLEREQRYDAAIQSYEDLIKSKPDNGILLEAKVRLGRILLEEKKDPDAARPYFDEAVTTLDYPDVAAAAKVYRGRAQLMRASREKDSEAGLESALGQFDSVILTYGQFPAVAEARFSAAAILEMQGKYDRARSHYIQLVSQFPESPKVPTAFLQLARMLAKQGHIDQALQAYQNVQVRYEGKEPAAQAEDEVTMLYRLFALKKRSPEIFKQATYSEKSDSFGLDDPYLMYWSNGTPLVLNRKKDLLSTATGLPIQVVKGSATIANHPIFYLKDSKRQQFDAIDAIAINQYQHILVGAHGPNGLYRVNQETGEAVSFIPDVNRVSKIAVDSEGRFYVLNEARTELKIYDTRGRSSGTVSTSSIGHKELVDFALDTFDDIYLLDREGLFTVIGGINQQDSRLRILHRQQVTEPKSPDAKPMKDLRALTVAPNGDVFVVNRQYVVSFK